MTMIESTVPVAKDIRELEITEVCQLAGWLERYRRLEHNAPRNAKDLINILGKESREFDGDRSARFAPELAGTSRRRS